MQAALALLLCGAAKADEMQERWKIAPGEREYLGTGNLERGAAYNPVTGHVLLASRFDTQIHILDGATGADLGTLNPGDGFSGGLFAINLVEVTDDGVIYVGNLSTSTTAPLFKLYRWENESAAPTVAFEGDPAGTKADGTSNNAQRWGDSMDVRGSGLNTQVLIAANAAGFVALLTTANGTEFTSKLIPASALSTGATSVAFGAGNTFWAKKSGVQLRLLTFNPTAGTSAQQRAIPAGTVPNTVVSVASGSSSNWLAGISVNAAVDDVRLYDTSDLAALFIVDQEVFPADNANGNGVADLDFNGENLVALNPNNGLVAYRIIRSVTPPSFATQPASTTFLQGGYGSLSGAVAGSRPISLQWQFNGVDVANATSAALLLTNITDALAGSYTLIASNAAGLQTSSVATVSIQPAVYTGRLTPLWNLQPGARPYLTTGDTERGLAFNKNTGRVLMVSRSSGFNIHVLDGETGANLWALQVPADVIIGGTFRLNMVAVADDGAVYACNLDTGGTAFAIYRWENDTTNSVPTVAWSGAPVSARRWGDTLAARGSGADTQLLAASNVTASESNNVAAVFTTTDGVTFQAAAITTENVNDDALRLGIAFGSGNTFWGKATTHPLRHVQFDLATGAGAVLRTITNTPSLSAPLGVLGESNLVALLAFENPENVRLYDTTGEGSELALLDQELLPTDNANINGTGNIAFGTNRVYVLDSNNGIQAYSLNAGGTAIAATFSNPARTGTAFNVMLAGTANASYRIEGSSDFSAWTTVQTVTVGASGSVQVTDNSGADYRFYRAVAQ